MTTFALGTAAGDWTANGLHLGYLVSGVVFAVLIAIPAVAHRWLGLGAIAAFWASYVVTRPLGASFADWMAVSPAHGGLGSGTGPVTLVFCVAIVGFVTYLGSGPHRRRGSGRGRGRGRGLRGRRLRAAGRPASGTSAGSRA